ncbi:hypothetical protein BOX37_13155 [Nocardia mangyaensis]|uniref:HTH araC/xylS-type domain-containing protein n=2 Tax=Nocardia mangyaensis TaxID=2213200 RepID=A0A1J0VRU8_9NOCA|nr:hypothetical protein BOX37_13155 [Nocardia mangyaensis]
MDVHILCELLDRNGYDSASILTAAGISPDILSRHDSEITRQQELDLHTLFAATTRDRLDIWVECGRRNTFRAWGDFGMANITAPTLSHVRYLAETHGGGTGRYPAVREDGLFTGLAIAFDHHLAPGTPGHLFEVVREAIAGVVLYTELWGAPFPFADIQVPAETAAFGLSDYVDAPIRYGEGPLLFAWPVELDKVPLPHGDQLLHQQYVAKLDRSDMRPVPGKSIEVLVSDALERMIDVHSGLDGVAAELGISRRTLQRRLTESGIDFRRVRASVRLKRAADMLRSSDATISEIASLVGYLEVSSFSHAFRRWSGESPRQYRRRWLSPTEVIGPPVRHGHGTGLVRSRAVC